MTSIVSALCLAFLLLGKTGVMPDLKLFSYVRFLSANVGDDVTLQCICTVNSATHYWYKQTLGWNPRLLCDTNQGKVTFHGEFQNNPRFAVKIHFGTSCNLMITNLSLSDSATYYCAKDENLMLEFAEGTTLNVQGPGLDVHALVHQPSSKTIQPGGSVALNCTVPSGTCNEKHNVYWFKSAEDNQPEVIYAYGGSNNQCGASPVMQSQACIFTTQTLDVSQAGTYYCAVVSCGYILFGNKTKVDLNRDVVPPILVFFLSGAFAVTTILILFLASSMYKMNKCKSCRLPENQARSPAHPTNDAQGSQDDLHYAALSHYMSGRSRTQTNMAECVYTTARQ
ncbi:uncharacterized protein LOC117504987 [Thalassophryne amazonica]|uniref:uncharacterized protein LOC117504987 n=1 Tax=Thalassophryne amazonica TaxID=390379 RepID=UPI00147174BD|nr:uncharacterized protein LOC117504987 [Thalassophryne amazonica]